MQNVPKKYLRHRSRKSRALEQHLQEPPRGAGSTGSARRKPGLPLPYPNSPGKPTARPGEALTFLKTTSGVGTV